VKPCVIESPFAGDVPRNKAYLQACIRDCLMRGETPYASHQMLTEALDDNVPEQREQGMAAGWAMRETIGFVAFYVDLGWSGGMKGARVTYDGGPDGTGKLTEYEERRLPAEVLAQLWVDAARELSELRTALGVAHDESPEEAVAVARQAHEALAAEEIAGAFDDRDSESLRLLRECIDENLQYPSEEAEEAGDYEAAVRFAADRLLQRHLPVEAEVAQ
jgi:hypothetical protein